MRLLKVFTIAVALLFAWALPLFAGIIEVLPSGYSSNGPSIAGWNWLRLPAHYAEWTFQMPDGIRVDRAVVCFSALSTNTTNGGAGFDSRLKVVSGARSPFLDLNNDCSCLLYPRYSRGIGYTSHGCLKNVYPLPGEMYTIRVGYRGGHHSAMKRDSAKLIIVTMPSRYR